jgi:hypothetical protein
MGNGTLRAITVLVCSALGSVSAHAQQAHPAPGTKIVHFAEVDRGIYKGSPPHSDADYRFLQSLHIRYILVLHFWPVFPQIERRRAREYGISVISAFLPASPFEPSEAEVTRVLETLRNKGCRPIYVHCTLGRDRTSMIAALYRMYFVGVPITDAIEYMNRSGYTDSWLIGGLRRYVKGHPEPPASLSAGGVVDRESCGVTGNRSGAN